MSFFDIQTRKVFIDAENWVNVRVLTRGDQESIFERSKIPPTKFTPAGSTDDMKISRLMLETAIVSWEGPGFDGRPVTKENILALPSPITTKVMEAVQDFTNLDGDEKKA